VDLHDHDDVVAGILMDLTRRETEPRTMALARTLVDHMGRHIGPLYKKPLQQAGFSVLKAPDIPSVLIELGFLSSPGDLDNLQNAEWRARAAQSIADAIADWSQSDAAQGALIRQ
jgi:N-acetylmuramoyl-L-alanine amidase